MKWISVDDQLPPTGKDILAWTISSRGNPIPAGEGYYAVDQLQGSIGEEYFRAKVWAYGKVTHWMPLPEPPK